MFKNRTSAWVIFLPFLLFTLVISGVVSAQQTVGVFALDTAAFEGYTLFTTLRTDQVYLIDMYGRVCHSWYQENSAGTFQYLLDDGSILRNKNPNAAGDSAGVQRIAWDGTLLWDYTYQSETYQYHHDIEPLANGNVLILAWEFISVDSAIALGRNPATLVDSMLWPEHVIEVKPTGPTSGEIVWEWHVLDHIIQDYDSLKPNFGVVADHPELIDLNYAPIPINDWQHANSLAYNPELDQIVISCNFFNEIWVIDHSTTTEEAAGHTGGNINMGGDLIYRWGNPEAYDAGTEADRQLFGQHDAHWIAPGLRGEGRLMVFDNGRSRPEGVYSRIIEIETTVNAEGGYIQPLPGTPHGPAAPAWEYTTDPPEDLYSNIISGAQRLPNGNTIICEGRPGHLFEVTEDSDIVWDYINPSMGDVVLDQGEAIVPSANMVFRTTRYRADHPGLLGRDLTPGTYLEGYPVAFSGTGHWPPKPCPIADVAVSTEIFAGAQPNNVDIVYDAGNGEVTVAMAFDSVTTDGGYAFSGIIPPQPAGTFVRYHLDADVPGEAEAFDPPQTPEILFHYTVGTELPQVVINEVMANNVSTIENPDQPGLFPDWIELKNLGTTEVDLSGMYLTNTMVNPTRWLIPSGITVAPGDFVLFWADGRIEDSDYHTNFMLSDGGQTIGLFSGDASGNCVIDTATYSDLDPDVSAGRSPVDEHPWVEFEMATPGETNVTFVCGDASADEIVNVGDAIWIVNYIFKGGPAPDPLEAADASCDGDVTIGDAVYLVNFIFKGGAEPCAACQ